MGAAGFLSSALRVLRAYCTRTLVGGDGFTSVTGGEVPGELARSKIQRYIKFDSHKESRYRLIPPFLERVVGSTLLHFVLMCRVTSLVKNDTGNFFAPF